MNDKPTATNWNESLNLTTCLHVSSIFTFYIIIFTSIFVWKTKENSGGESFIKMTETLNMKMRPLYHKKGQERGFFFRHMIQTNLMSMVRQNILFDHFFTVYEIV